MATELPDPEAPVVDDVTASVVVDAAGNVFIVGYVLRWGQAGKTSAGRLVFETRESVDLPDDLSRVKLLIEHQTLGDVVGYGHAVDHDHAAAGLFMWFKVPDPALSSAIAAVEGVRLKLRDSFSPGIELSDGTRLRLRRAQLAPARGNGRLREVSLVVIPGFDQWTAPEGDQ